MEDYRQQQIEALVVAHEYCGKLLNGINNIVGELNGNRLPDTDAYLDEIVKGLNWVIEITNRTMDVINEDGEVIVKEQVNTAVSELSEALKSKEDAKIAAALGGGVREYISSLEKATERF